jgi:hypothetical protein
MTGEFRRRAVEIDVGGIVRRSVASLYSHLVTRPTGRAVRLAIETQLAEVGETAFSVIDLTEVTVLDFSCADEVVAKLLLRYMKDDRPREAYFVFRGLAELHRDPIEAVLERQGLCAVAQGPGGVFELMGARSPEEGEVWRLVEEKGSVRESQLGDLLESGMSGALESLVGRRLVFRARTGDVHALSRLVGAPGRLSG